MAAHAASTSGPGTIHLLSFAAPIWLSGLGLLPVIRWLHRGGRQRRAVPVSRLGLWQRSVASSPAAGERRPPDPAWRRRALLTALLFVALSEPQLADERTHITLWIDDSLSMLTREAHGTRLAEGLAQARSLLAEVPNADVEVRTLGDPWQSVGALTGAAAETIATRAGRKTPTVPPASPSATREPAVAGHRWRSSSARRMAWRQAPGSHHPGRRRDAQCRAGAAVRTSQLERPGTLRSAPEGHERRHCGRNARGRLQPRTRAKSAGLPSASNPEHPYS